MRWDGGAGRRNFEYGCLDGVRWTERKGNREWGRGFVELAWTGNMGRNEGGTFHAETQKSCSLVITFRTHAYGISNAVGLLLRPLCSEHSHAGQRFWRDGGHSNHYRGLSTV